MPAPDGPNMLALLAVLAWPIAQLGLLRRLPVRVALWAGIVGGWLLLPHYRWNVPHLPDLDKATVVVGAALVGAVAFDRRPWRAVRPIWLDVPVATWCVAPLASSLANGLGVYDGLSAMLFTSIRWGVPYSLGRVYFGDLAGLRTLAIGLVLGGLASTPPIVCELVYGPVLRHWVYGLEPAGVDETLRFGGWRPVVFQENGLMLAVILVGATVAAFWIWRTGVRRRLLGVAIGSWASLLALVTVAMKSINGWILLALGVGISERVWRRSGEVLLVVLLCSAPVYVALRASGLWRGEALPALTRVMFSRERGISVEYRLINEDRLRARALEQPLFGWGGWGRARPAPGLYFFPPIPESLWILTLGENGMVGMISVLASLVLPGFAFHRRYRPAVWRHPWVAPGGALVIYLALAAIDSCLNMSITPLHTAALGALAGAAAAPESPPQQ